MWNWLSYHPGGNGGKLQSTVIAQALMNKVRRRKWLRLHFFLFPAELNFAYVLETGVEPHRLRAMRNGRVAMRVREVLCVVPVAARSTPLHRWSDLLRALPDRLRLQIGELSGTLLKSLLLLCTPQTPCAWRRKSRPPWRSPRPPPVSEA